MTLTLSSLNALAPDAFVAALNGIYEHSPWISERAVHHRPFATLDALKQYLQAMVMQADPADRMQLIRAHPELAGKAAISGELTRESTGEQASAGLTHCSPEEFARLQELNAAYNEKFGFPFILAVKGPEGKGLTRGEIIATFSRRLRNSVALETDEALRQIHRIAEIRLNDLFGHTPKLGHQIMTWAQYLSHFSDDEHFLTCAYMAPAHRQTAAQLAIWMREAGMRVEIDAVGNVVGRYLSGVPNAKVLITGSHYDTVRNAGKYDGREGILLAIAVVRHLHERGETLPFDLEVIAFSEEEGVRFKSTFLGSNAVAGNFDMALLDREDADGITMRSALTEAGHDVSRIPTIARDPNAVLGYVEVHIEQGPVLLEHGLPVGIVTSIAGSCRYLVHLAGVASHAGTTPMTMRHDAAAAASEIVLYVERRCASAPSLVGTVGQLQVANGSVNVVPGSCDISLDIRATDDVIRDAAVADILNEISSICTRRGIEYALDLLVRAPAVPCAPWLMQQLDAATKKAGIAPFQLLSGAGHDAMAVAALTDVAMLFTRCGNGGISHNPLETMTADDAEISAQIFLDFLRNFQAKPATAAKPEDALNA